MGILKWFDIDVSEEGALRKNRLPKAKFNYLANDDFTSNFNIKKRSKILEMRGFPILLYAPTLHYTMYICM